MKLRIILTSCATLATLAAAPAVHADVMFSGHAGAAFGGEIDDTVATYGGAITLMGDGLLGVEIEAAFTPDFFSADDTFVFDQNHVSTLMAHLLVGGGHERARFFVSVGGGLLQTRGDTTRTDLDPFFDLDIDNDDFGASAGVGGMGFFSDNFGVRGDVRYYRRFGEDDAFELELGDFGFWRGTAGLVVRF